MKTLQHFIITLLALLIIGFFGCSKESTSVGVMVFEKGTNKSAVGIPVNFGYSSSGGVFSGQVVEQTQVTDANGKVSFKGEDKKAHYSVGYPNGVDYFGDGTSLNQNEHNTIFLYTYPFAYVRVHAKNVNPFDSNDHINIAGGEGFLYGANVDTIVIQGPFKGTQNGILGWDIYKNNINTHFSTELYFVGRDTINYTIEY